MRDEVVIAARTNTDVAPALAMMMKTPSSPDVIVCLAGRRTFAVHTAITNLGLRIPADVGLLKIDDFPWAQALGLTVIAQPADDGQGRGPDDH